MTDQKQITQTAQLTPSVNDDPIVCGTHRLPTRCRNIDSFVVKPTAFVTVSIHNVALHRPSE